jgi:molybdopterin-guanine dinucleotide biosynthesis protein B
VSGYLVASRSGQKRIKKDLTVGKNTARPVGNCPGGLPVFGVTGWKNSGKTTLVAALIDDLVGRGLKVGAIKHAHHSLEIDHEGRDSYKMRAAGAQQVALVSEHRFALIRELAQEPEPEFDQILQHFEGFDLVLVEGYKQLPLPKIEIRGPSLEDVPLIADEIDEVVAIASKDVVNARGLPVFSPDDTGAIADFIIDWLGLTV